MRDATLQFTYTDYLTLPEGGPRYQLVNGDLILSPSPTYRHQLILARLFLALASHVQARRLGEVICAPMDVKLSDTDVVQPDLLFISSARRRRLVARRGITGAPDLVIEILSKDRDLDLEVKRKLYARHGVPEYWTIDPASHEARVHRFQEGRPRPARRLGSGDLLTSPTFPDLTIDLTALFAP